MRALAFNVTQHLENSVSLLSLKHLLTKLSPKLMERLNSSKLDFSQETADKVRSFV